jgi:hypothetical protein
MRSAIVVLFVLASSNSAFAWRCNTPEAPKCPDRLCYHDPDAPSDSCVNGMKASHSESGVTLQATTPEAKEKLRSLSGAPKP